MTILEALRQIDAEMEKTYEAAFRKAGPSPTKIRALDFNGHRNDLRAVLQRLELTDGDANRELT